MMTDETKPVRACSASPAEGDSRAAFDAAKKRTDYFPRLDIDMATATEEQIFAAIEEIAWRTWQARAALSNVQPKGTWRANDANDGMRYPEQRPVPASAEAHEKPVAFVRHTWNRSGARSLVFEKPDELSLAEEATGVEYEPLYAAAPAPAPAPVAEKLPEPFGYFCEWAQRGTYPPTQTMYYGGPGNGLDDDWNCHPEVHKNIPLFTADQMRDYARATQNTQAPAVAASATVKDSLPVAPLADIERINSRRWRFAFIESDNWTYAVCKWDGDDWIPINTAADVQELDDAMSASKPPVQHNEGG